MLPGESSQEFHQLCENLEAEWQPQAHTEQFYLEQMAVSQRKFTRMELAEESILKQITNPEAQIPMLDRIWQCQSRMERSFARAQRELKRLQTTHPRLVPNTTRPSPHKIKR